MSHLNWGNARIQDQKREWARAHALEVSIAPVTIGIAVEEKCVNSKTRKKRAKIPRRAKRREMQKQIEKIKMMDLWQKL